MERRALSRRERPAKSALSREAVVAAALGILREEGLEKVTMRRIATALETGAASLYVYVRDTKDLHAQLLDALLIDLPAPKPGRRWRADLHRVAEAFLHVLMRYPEIARMTMSNHSTGPGSLRLLDTIAGLLLEGGANVRAASWGVDLVLAYTVATAVEHAEREDDERLLDDLRQMVVRLDKSKHPHLAMLGLGLISGEGLERFRWGLEAIVTGILTAPESTSAPGRARR